jgi:hypothetical protein
MTDVFISYKREERDKVILVADRLRALGLDVWFDARLTTGHHFDREIDDHVRTAKCVLVCWSPAALTSDWVRSEAAIGRERGVIVPVLVEACSPPVPFNTMQTESLIGWSGDGEHDGWQRIISRIGALTDRPNLADAERERGAAEVETRRLQAMLDAQRREEEQAQRRAEAASVERARLEAELSSRGAAVSRRALQPVASNAPTPPSAAAAAPWFSMRVIIVAVAVAILASITAYQVAGAGFRQDMERVERESADLRERQASEAREALTGYWCRYNDSPLALAWRYDAPDWVVVIRDGEGLRRERTATAESSSTDHLVVREGDWLYSFGVLGASLVRAEHWRPINYDPGAPADPAAPSSSTVSSYYSCSEQAALSWRRPYVAQ